MINPTRVLHFFNAYAEINEDDIRQVSQMLFDFCIPRYAHCLLVVSDRSALWGQGFGEGLSLYVISLFCHCHCWERDHCAPLVTIPSRMPIRSSCTR